jgi:predicted ribosome quality control (RQC) complex YloA/Tae2 family protein
LEQLTIIQLGDASSPGDIPLIQEQPEGRDKDKEKKKSKSKLKSGKQTKSTVKAPVSAKKASTNTAPSSKKKILQGLLILRPSLGGSKVIPSDRDRDRNEESDTRRKGNREKGSDRDSSDNNMPVRLPPLIVGRSSKQNDRITFEIAKEHHLWFHVQVSISHHSTASHHTTTHISTGPLCHIPHAH